MDPTAAEAHAKKEAKVKRKQKTKAERKQVTNAEDGQLSSPVAMNSDGSYSPGPLPSERPYTLDEVNASQSASAAPSNLVPQTNTPPNPSSSQSLADRPFSVVPPSTNASNPDLPSARPTSSLSQPSSARLFTFVPPTSNTSNPTIPGSRPTTSSSQPAADRPSSILPPSTNVFSPAINIDQTRSSLPPSNGPRLDDIISSVNSIESYAIPAQRTDPSLSKAASTSSFQIPPQPTGQEQTLYTPLPPGVVMRQHFNDPEELNRQIYLMEERETIYEKEIQRLDVEARNKVAQEDAMLSKANELIKAQELQIDTKDKTIAELEQRCHGLSAKFDELSEKYSQYDASLNQHLESEAAKDEMIAQLKELNSNIELKSNDLATTSEAGALDVKADEEIQTRDIQITELKRKSEQAEDKYKILITSHQQDKIRVQRDLEEKEDEILILRTEIEEIELVNKKFGRRILDAEKEAKTSVSNMRASEDRVEEQAKIIKENERTINGLQATVQRLKKEFEDEKDNVKLHRESDSHRNGNLDTQTQRLRSETEKEIKNLRNFYGKKHVAEERHLQDEFSRVQQEKDGLEGDLDKLQQQVRGHDDLVDDLRQTIQGYKHTIDECQKEIQYLKQKLTSYKTRETKKPEASEERATESEFDNELSQFSPAPSLQGTSEQWSAQWQPRTESMYSGTDDEVGDDNDITITQPAILDLGTDVLYMCDQGMQTETPSTPVVGMNKPVVVVNDKPAAVYVCDQGMQTDIPSPTSIPSISKLSSNGSGPAALEMCDQGTQADAASTPANPRNSEPVYFFGTPTTRDTCDQGIQTDAPLSPIVDISKPVLVFDSKPAPPDMCDQGTQADAAPLSAKFNNSEPVYVFDLPTFPDTCDQGTQTDALSSQFGISKLTTLIDTAPTSAVIPPGAAAGKQPIKRNHSRWQWLWYLLMVLIVAVLAFAVLYGESARRERQMWLKANDVTRRAVISVRAGGGSGSSVPGWLWKDQLLDVPNGYEGSHSYGTLARR